MPVSPALAENLARAVVARYAEAERLLLARIAKRLAAGQNAPHWAEVKLAQVGEYERQAQALLAALEKQATREVRTAIVAAYERGGLAAVAEMSALGVKGIEPLAGLRAAEALAQETIGYVVATHPRILRASMDLYRSVVAETAQQVLLGTQTRLQASQSALDRFAAKGITGFVDKAGRGWTMESYVEMATRTGVGKAAVAGHTARLQQNGLDLVIVSDAPKECPLCAVHEGKVYSISGTDPKYPPLADARAAGLFHVNCRHSVSLYQPGITPPMGDVADPEGYRATEQLRYLERQVRASKRMEAAAMDEAALAKAKRRKLDYQAKIRAHVAATTAKRQPHRERLGAL